MYLTCKGCSFSHRGHSKGYKREVNTSIYTQLKYRNGRKIFHNNINQTTQANLWSTLG